MPVELTGSDGIDDEVSRHPTVSVTMNSVVHSRQPGPKNYRSNTNFEQWFWAFLGKMFLHSMDGSIIYVSFSPMPVVMETTFIISLTADCRNVTQKR